MDKIEELLTRAVDKIYPTKEEFEKVLRSGKKLKLYQGFDPTGAQLHIGHMVGLRKLKQWQELGHKVVFLIGDFTGMIGDPSGKTETRKMLTKEEVQKNAQYYIEQAGRILNFKGKNPVEILYNSAWLGKISAIEFLRIAGLLSVQQVVERDLFQERQKQGQDIYMNEFLYPVMQAYDSVAMNVDLEIGGKDQMFNMLMGRKLMRHMLKKDKFVMTTPLLTDSKGNKIGKTEGNIIALTDKPKDLYAKIMALGDDVIIKGFEYLTDVPLDEIKKIEEAIKQGENPVGFKKKLAFEIVKQLNNEQAAKEAILQFEDLTQHKKASNVSIPEFEHPIDSKYTLSEVLVKIRLASSKSDAKRVIQQGGITVNNNQINDINYILPLGEHIVGRANRKFVKIKTAH